MAVEIDLPQKPKPADPMAYLRAEAEMEKSRLVPRGLSQPPTAGASASLNSSPLEGQYRISQRFGNYNPGLYAGRTAGAKHYGLDVATPQGTQVKSPFAGVVKYGTSKDFGNYVQVKTQDGNVMQFSHLSGVDDLVRKLAETGQMIQAGQMLGLTGNTGYSTAPHLDIMYQQQGKYIDPLAYEPLRRQLGV
jgi:murein DD-endopeptidase MepM/ murein hydrolase activator NlpD